MKHKVKNRMIKGVSLALAATAVTGLLLQTTMSVQAATAMPGIETISRSGFLSWWKTAKTLKWGIMFPGRNLL